jgi:hypothetical protein
MFDLIIDTEILGGPTESPLVRAKALANAELRQRATAEEQAWLTTNPVLWLRALTWFAEETRLHIGTRRTAVKMLTDEQLRRAEAERLVLSQHFLKRCEQRIAEVSMLIGPDQLGAQAGDVLTMLLRIAALLRADRIEEAEQALNSTIGLVAKHAKLGPAPDNSAAAPMKLVVYGLRPKTRINCRACGRAKLDPHESDPRCAVCGQRHLFERS